MIERQFIEKKKREFMIQEFIASYLPKSGYSHIELKKTPLGEKIVVHTSRPGLVVGRRGANIAELTETLREKFKMENPQIEVAEIENPNLNPKSVADRIVYSFERFGPKRFKSLGYRALQDILDAGAIGAEIVISGRGVPSSRAKSWRFSAGHLKKSGDVSENLIKRACETANLKSGSIGIKVSILTPDILLPDTIKIKKEDKEIKVIETKEEIKEEVEVKEEKKKSERKKKVKAEEVKDEVKEEKKDEEK